MADTNRTKQMLQIGEMATLRTLTYKQSEQVGNADICEIQDIVNCTHDPQILRLTRSKERTKID